MARRKREPMRVSPWSEAAESVWTRLASESLAERTAALTATQTPTSPLDPLPASSATTPSDSTRSPTPNTIIDGHPTKAHPWNRRFLPHQPETPARNGRAPGSAGD